MKYSGIGGQAVIEGIMMKNQNKFATAVRKPDGDITLQVEDYKSFIKSKKLLNTPIFRGVFSFIDSMILGMKTLTFSANFFVEEEEEKPGKLEEFLTKIFGGRLEKILTTVVMVISFVLAIGIFMVLPLFIANIFRDFITSPTLMALIEGLIRITIFVGYIMLISNMKDIKRTFMYHGAEHKCINCLEHGLELTVDNVRKSSKQHKRCGTSFLLIVVVISIFFTMIVRVDDVWMRALSRILLVPLIAGVSYEFLRLAGRSDSALVNILSKPGMWMQNLTTKEPEEDMIEVAIAATEAVFDWKPYLLENFPEKSNEYHFADQETSIPAKA